LLKTRFPWEAIQRLQTTGRIKYIDLCSRGCQCKGRNCTAFHSVPSQYIAPVLKTFRRTPRPLQDATRVSVVSLLFSSVHFSRSIHLKPPLLPTKDRLNKTHKGPCSVTHSTIGAISCSSVLSSSLTKASPLGQSERVTTASRAYCESMFPSSSLNVLPFGKTTASLPEAFY
jgi:hypothetical protein